MNLQVDLERVLLAHKAVRAELLSERTPRGHWVGHVASSPFATAAAVSALVVAHQPDTQHALRQSQTGDGQVIEHLVQGDLCEFLVDSVHWLARHQNPDGGWGDCDTGRSTIGATMMVQAAFRLTGVPAKYADLIVHADQYVAAHGGIGGLRRHYGHNKTLAASILANCALAGMVPWRQVPTLPFELVCLPKRWQQHVQIPAVQHSTANLIAVGRAKFHHDPPRNPITRLLRRSLRAKSLAILERLQSADDSYLASTPATAFVVINVASIGGQEHAIVRRGIEFLLSSVRADASWPVENSLSTSITALALDNIPAPRQITAFSSHRGSEVSNSEWETVHVGDTVTDRPTIDAGGGQSSIPSVEVTPDASPPSAERSLNWLLETQHRQPNLLTEAPAGGWGWSDQPGAIPNTIDTGLALIALARLLRHGTAVDRQRAAGAARLAIAWLLELQSDDGGWPTFYRGSAAFQPDDSATDTTANALRALAAWRGTLQSEHQEHPPHSVATLLTQIGPAIERGWRYLESNQRDDGSYIPSWFGNEHQPDERNPVYGTAQVLMSCAEMDRLDTDLAGRAAGWLVSAQHSVGGWGPPRAKVDYSRAAKDGLRDWRSNESLAKYCSVEETALAVTALLPLGDSGQAYARAVSAGLNWLATAVEQDAHRRPAVIGLYLSKLWYHERLYPLVFAVGALSRAVTRLASERPAAAPVGSP